MLEGVTTRSGHDQNKTENIDKTHCLFGGVSICVFGFRLVITCRSSCPEEVAPVWGWQARTVDAWMSFKVIGDVIAIVTAVLGQERIQMKARRSSDL